MFASLAIDWSAGVLACVLAAAGTATGAVPALRMRPLSRSAEVAALASAAGLMLAAATLGLLGAAFELIDANGVGRSGRLGIIAMLNRVLPHEHFVKGTEGGLHGGLGAGALFADIVPLLLAVAAGAMVYVVGGEIIPESHRHGLENTAALSLIAGFVSFLLLDLVLA